MPTNSYTSGPARFSTAFLALADSLAHPHPPMKVPLHRVSVCCPSESQGVHYVLFVDRNFHTAGECEYVVEFFVDCQPLGSLFSLSTLVDEGLANVHHLARIRRSNLPTYQARRRKLVYGMAH